MSVGQAEATPKLERGLGGVDATMIVMGSMIGSGIFITSADVARLVGSPGWLMVAWSLAGLLTITGALCAAEVAAMIPRAGGQYVFLREAYGRSIGFVFGWSTFLGVQTGTIAAVSVAFAKFLGVLVPWVSATNHLLPPRHLGGYAVSLSSQQLVAVALIAGLTWINTRGLRMGKLIQNVFTFTKTAALIGLILVGLIHARNPLAAAWSTSWWNPSANGWTIQAGLPFAGALGFAMVLGKAMVGPLFSQTAWNSVTFTGGEVRNPGKTLPRALLIGCGTVVVLYLLANAGYILTLPLDQIQHADNDRVGTATMEALFPTFGAGLMAAAILVSTFGCVNGLILSGARVTYAMARDGLFFRRAGCTNAQHVPAFALVTQGIWAVLLALPVTVALDHAGKPTYGNVYNQLLDYIIPVDLLFYTLMVGSVVLFRLKSPGVERPYRTFGYPITPLIYITLASLLILNFVYLSPQVSGIGFLIALTGLPVYLAWSRFGRPAATETDPTLGTAPR
jgi:APA family basic amino acid/polyamine antiporter